MTFTDRIKLFIEYRGINKSKFEKACGLSNGYINSVKGNPSESKIRAILSAFPELNLSWLLTGEGNMLNDKTTNDKNVAVVSVEQEEPEGKTMDLSEFIADTLQSIALGVSKASNRCELLGAVVNPYDNKGTIHRPHNLSTVHFKIGLSKNENLSGEQIGVLLPKKYGGISHSMVSQSETSTTIDFDILVRLPETEVKE